MENAEISDPEEDDLVKGPQHFELVLGASLGLEYGEDHLVLTADLVDGHSLAPAEHSMSSIHVNGGGLGCSQDGQSLPPSIQGLGRLLDLSLEDEGGKAGGVVELERGAVDGEVEDGVDLGPEGGDFPLLALAGDADDVVVGDDNVVTRQLIGVGELIAGLEDHLPGYLLGSNLLLELELDREGGVELEVGVVRQHPLPFQGEAARHREEGHH